MTQTNQAAESWIAGLLEHRVALGIAAGASIALIIMLVMTPSKEPGRTTVSVSGQPATPKAVTSDTPRYAIPDKQQKTDTRIAPAAAKKVITPDTPAQAIRPIQKAPAPVTNRPAVSNKASVASQPVVKAAPAKPAVASSPNVSGHVYFVQVGAYRERNGARQQAATLLQQGWNSSVSSNDKGLYVVRIGPVSTRQAADKLRSQLMDKAKLKGFVVEG